MESILALTVRSTRFFLIDGGKGKLLVDAGWGMAEFSAQLKTYKIPITDIRYILFTHHHPDHAGLVQPIKEASAARLLIQSCQLPFLEDLQAYASKKGDAFPIKVAKTDLINPTRTDLARMGIAGEVLETPGHSPDSISLVLDSGTAFIGDLGLPGMVDESMAAETCASWRSLLRSGVYTFQHSHAGAIPAERVRQAMALYCD